MASASAANPMLLKPHALHPRSVCELRDFAGATAAFDAYSYGHAVLGGARSGVGGCGGAICVDRTGRAAAAFPTERMAWAVERAAGSAEAVLEEASGAAAAPLPAAAVGELAERGCSLGTGSGSGAARPLVL